MAYKTIQDSSLTAVANAIRTKAGTSDPLVFPADFVAAINALQTDWEDWLKDWMESGYETTPEIRFPDGLTTIPFGWFAYKEIDVLTLPASITTLAHSNTFYQAHIPEIDFSLTQLTTLPMNLFGSHQSVKKVRFPATLTSLGPNCFYNASSMKLYDFRQASVVPTIPAQGTIYPLTNTKTIVVPDALYDEWISATNWTYHAASIVKASEYVE